ncbi:hypothetical protein J4G37_12805 [Microvirga sp. 3-52]|nr:hypothetical protein [Microvirga sp. 3-52]
MAVPVSSRKTKRLASMKRCHTRKRRRSWATSGGSCSAARSVFFVHQIDALEHQVNGRERLYLDPTGPQLTLDIGQRDAGLGVHEGAQQILR